MEPPHLPTETLAASRARTSKRWSPPVPPNLQMSRNRALFRRLEESVLRDKDSLAERVGFEPSVPPQYSLLSVQRGGPPFLPWRRDSNSIFTCADEVIGCSIASI